MFPGTSFFGQIATMPWHGDLHTSASFMAQPKRQTTCRLFAAAHRTYAFQAHDGHCLQIKNGADGRLKLMKYLAASYCII
jgi:hypothetical protein